MKRIIASLLLTGLAGLAPAEKPNVLFLFADDMTYEAIHALGFDEIRTPNLDRLVEGGTTFTHAYNSGGWHGAVCVASRTMLLTGRQLWHAQKVDNAKTLQAEFVDQGKCWSQLMSAAGYETFMSGKWHVKADTGTIFDHVRHERPGMPKSVKAAYNRPLEGKEDPWNPADTVARRILGGRQALERSARRTTPSTFLAHGEDDRQAVLHVPGLQRAARSAAVAPGVRGHVSGGEGEGAGELPGVVSVSGPDRVPAQVAGRESGADAAHEALDPGAPAAASPDSNGLNSVCVSTYTRADAS